MFTYVTLENFKSFNHISFDLCNKANTPNKLILIYGKNGSGKSNLVSSFALLKDSLITMSSIRQYEEFIKDLEIDDNNPKILDRFKRKLVTTEKIIKNYRTIGINENDITTAKYEFIIDGKTGSYTISYNSNELVFEELSFSLNERRGVIFSFKKGEEGKIKPAITSNKDFYNELVLQSKMYWGKHTFLSIIRNEIMDKSDDFAYNTINPNFNKITSFFHSFTCKINGTDSSQIDVMHNSFIFNHPRFGYSRNVSADILNDCADIISPFLNKIDNKITKVFYKTNDTDYNTEYELYLTEKFNNQLIDIPQSKESNGTKTIIDLLFHLLSALNGDCVILDECDSTIHDLLFSNILKDMYAHIKGQLIITTHNTALMENNELKDAIYIITNKDNINSISSIAKNSKRIFDTNNIRNKYKQGEYNGIPEPSIIDYDLLTNKFSDLEDRYYTSLINNYSNKNK